MSVYGSGAEAFRDTTKWLVAFVPIAAIVASGAVLGPRLVGAMRAADSISDLLAANGLPLLGLVMVVVVVSQGANVLSTQPKELGDLEADTLAAAFNDGVGAPYFFDVGTYKEAMAELQAAFDVRTQVRKTRRYSEQLLQWMRCKSGRCRRRSQLRSSGSALHLELASC